MPYGTFMVLVMIRLLLNTRSVKVISHREKCPAIRNTPKKRTFDCIENDEASDELNESSPKRPKLQ